MRPRALLVSLLVLLSAAACSNAEKDALRATTKPTYDEATGKLKQLTFDYDKNGRIDTWTEMDGARPVLTKMDRNEDGRLDRWEYYNEKSELVKVGFSRGDTGKVDAWAFSGASGQVERIEVSTTGDETKIDRWERYDASGLLSAEEDTDGDGRADKWEAYREGALKTVAFDENKDGRPDRRLTYDGSVLVLIESGPDGAGGYQMREMVERSAQK